MKDEEVKDIVEKLNFGFKQLSSLFDYKGGLEFIVDTSVGNEDLVRIEVRKEGKRVYDDPIERPTSYRDIGQFVGSLLYSLVNPACFEYTKMRRKKFIKGILQKERDVVSYVCEENIVMNIIILACGKIIGEAANEKYILKSEEGIKSDFEKNYELMERLYSEKGELMINELARLSGREGRMKIIEICGTDIMPSQEQ